MAKRYSLDDVLDMIERQLYRNHPELDRGKRGVLQIPFALVVRDNVLKGMVVAERGENIDQLTLEDPTSAPNRRRSEMDGLEVATTIFSSLLKAHMGIDPESLQFEEGGDWIAWLQHVEALLAHAEDHDDEEDPNEILREGVAAVAMTIELLVNKEPHRTFDANTGKRLRQPSVDINVLLKQLTKRASS